MGYNESSCTEQERLPLGRLKACFILLRDRRTNDPNQLIVKDWAFQYFLVDPLRQGRAILIVGADNDATMDGIDLVQTNEVASVEGNHCPTLRNGKGEDIGVLNTFARSTRLGGRQHVVAEFPKLENNRLTKVLIGMELGHANQASSFSRIACSISFR
jgi:hypothetical protein